MLNVLAIYLLIASLFLCWPQYDGDWTPDAVKKRIIELMYSWTVGLPKETKIIEAYKMLKQTGTVTIISRNMIMYFAVDWLSLYCIMFLYVIIHKGFPVDLCALYHSLKK